MLVILSGHYLIVTLILRAKYCYTLKLQRRKLRHREVEQLPRVSKSDIWAGSLGRPVSPGMFLVPTAGDLLPSPGGLGLMNMYEHFVLLG